MGYTIGMLNKESFLTARGRKAIVDADFGYYPGQRPTEPVAPATEPVVPDYDPNEIDF